MITGLTIPNTYSAGYSAIPLRIKSDNVDGNENFSYIININYNEEDVSTFESTSFGNNVYTEVTTENSHNFDVGDVVFVSDENGDYTGLYNIIEILDSTSFIIDLTLGAPVGGQPISLSNTILYKMSPNPYGEARLDLSNTLKDFVTQNLEDTPEIFNGSNTEISYNLSIGEEFTYVFNFEDNTFLSGDTGFFNTTITSLSGVPFQIGDVIEIQQDLFEWTYTDNQFSAGNLAFIGPSVHNFISGQTITVTGQETEPYYNGPVTIKASAATNSTLLVTDKTFTTSTPVEGGKIYGVPRPEYNTVATIKDIYIDGLLGLVVHTDVGFAGSSQAIPGKIRYANRAKKRFYRQLEIDNLHTYNSRINTLGYTSDAFDKFVVQDRDNNLNNISTILDEYVDTVRIERDSKSWLLVHSDDSNAKYWEPNISFYDSNNNFLSTYRLDLVNIFGQQISVNTYSNNGGNLRINLISAHGLNVGDFIEIFQSISNYNGVAEVIQVNTPSSITVNVTFTTSSLLGAENIRRINSTGSYDYYFPVGIDQINSNTNKTLLSGSSLTSIISDINSYNVSLESEGVINSNDISFKLNDDCSRYDAYFLMWKDRNGSYISYPFKYISEDTSEFERKTYYKGEGVWRDNNTFGYDSFGRGDTTYFTRSRDKMMLNSGWVTEQENELIKDLLKSADVYVQTPDGTLLGCVIEDKSKKFPKLQSDYLWQYMISIRLSNNDLRL